jgi:hypothetical protein
MSDGREQRAEGMEQRAKGEEQKTEDGWESRRDTDPILVLETKTDCPKISTTEA